MLDTDRAAKEIKRFLKQQVDNDRMDPEILAELDWNDMWAMLILALIYGWDGNIEKEDDNGRSKNVC